VKPDGGTYAAIDLGSNSISLAVYRMDKSGMTLLNKDKAMAGIIGCVQEGRISEEGVRRAAGIVTELHRKAREAGAEVFCFATASLRGVKNRRDVLDAIRRETGLEVDVMPWEREAYYDYLAVERLTGVKNALAADIGGGSIELLWIRNNSLYRSASLPTGSLKLCRDYVMGVRPGLPEMERIEAAVNAYLDGVAWVGQTGCGALCTVGGTARAVARLHKEIFPPDKNLGDYDYAYPAQDMDALLSVLADKEKHYKLIMKLCPDRIHTITPGFLALRAIVKRAGATRIALSRFGVREGYLIEKVWMKGEL
jgi:Exopolyphosphatase